MSFIIALLIFSFIVFIHELGHFLAAKYVGIKVEEFSIGMGPRVFTHHGRETDYSVKLLPFGGSCMMLGEDDDGQIQEGSFNSKTIFQRFLVIFAGPLFNFILAFIMALLVISNIGIDEAKLVEVRDGYPAQLAGIMPGDIITRVDNKKVVIYRDLTGYLYMNGAKKVSVEVERENDGAKERLSFELEPKFDENYNTYMLGIVGVVERKKLSNPLSIIKYSAYEVWYNISSTISGLAYMIKGKIGADNISGPVGIVRMVGDTVSEGSKYGFGIIMLLIGNMILLLSANLGIMNLIPIPALDGGRILFLGIEAISRGRFSKRIENIIHVAGFMLLMLIMVIVLFNDIKNIFL